METLQEIGFKYRTDKSGSNYGTHIFNGRSLLNTYENYFNPIRYERLNILELGILDGGSLKTWEEFFPNSNIVGLDISPDKKKFETDRTKIYIGSQDDENVISKIKQDYPSGFDIILDDASHINELTIKSYNLLFDWVKPAGFYIIEDTCCAYGLDEYPTFINDVKTWPGMDKNSPEVSFSNTRSQLNDFLYPKIRDLDMKVGDIYAMYFHSETLIIEKAI